MGYDAVIFDFDGVLMNSGFDGFQWALDERQKVVTNKGWNLELDKLEQGIFQPDHSKDITEVMSQEDVSWAQLKEMEKAVAERKVEMASTGEIEIFEDAEEILNALDCPKAIVSNAYNDYLQKLLEELDIENYIDFWIAPRIEDIRNYREKMKPEPEMVEEALEQLEAQNAVMIGDQVSDILAARNAGIDSIYINRSGDTEPRANHSVKSLTEALQIIQG
jgi:HAD superfamily hydrolase (TIGR01549 family)